MSFFPNNPTVGDTVSVLGKTYQWTGTVWKVTGSSFDGAFSSLTGTPTTIAGYGITDSPPLDNPTFTGTLHGVNGSFSGNLVSEVGGTQRVYGLGTEGDTNTHYLQSDWDGTFYRIGAKATGAGGNQSLMLDFGGSSRLLLSSSEVRLYKYLRPSDTTIDIGSVANPFRTVYSVNSSFSGNLNAEVGGSLRMFTLGTDGDTDTESLDIEYDSLNSKWEISTNQTGTGILRQLWFDASQYRMYESGTLLWIGESNEMRMYGSLVPSSDGLRSVGIASKRFGNVYSVDGSFSGNMITEVGGSPRIYNLGTDGDTDTEYLDISWQGGNCKFKSQTTGAGVERRLDFEGSGIRYIAAGITVADISAGDIRLYSGRTIRPLLDNDASVGKTAQRFTNVYSYAGNFAGTITNSATTSWSATFSRAIRVGADSGVSWYYGNGNMTKFNTPVTFESSFQFARPADGLTSRLYRMSKAASSFTCVPVDGGVSGNIIFQVEDATDTFQPLRTGGYVNHYPNNAGEQAYRMYNLGEVSDSDTEYGGFDFSTNVFRVGTQTTGTGVARDVGIIRDNSYKMYFGSSVATIYQTLVPNVTASYNVGSTTNYFARTFSQAVFTNIQTITAATDSLVTTDTTNLCDCTLNQIDIDIPISSSDYVGNEYVIKKIDASANTVVITPTGRTIEGAASLTLTTQYESVSIISDGTNWFIKHQT